MPNPSLSATLLEELGRLSAEAKPDTSRLPTSAPNQFWHTFDCNLGTLAEDGFRPNQVQSFNLGKGVTRLQYVSHKPYRCLFLDTDSEGATRFLLLDMDLQQKEQARYANLAQAETGLKGRIRVLERLLGRPTRYPVPVHVPPSLTPVGAKTQWESLRKSLRSSASLKTMAARHPLPALKAEHRALALDPVLFLAAVKSAAEEAAADPIFWVRAVTEPAALDAYAASLAFEAIEANLKASGKWLLSVAATFGGDATAERFGAALWGRLFESHGHIAPFVEGLRAIGTLGAAHELFAAESTPSRYANRRNTARDALHELAAALDLSVDELVLRSVPREPVGNTRERVLRVQARRLEEMMVDGARLPYSQLTAAYFDHPLLAELASRVVWGVFGAGEALTTSFRPVVGTALGADGKPAKVQASDRVGVAHPIELGAQVAAWRAALAKAKVAQPFLQLERSTYALTEKQRAGNELRDFHYYRREWLHEQGWWGYKQDSDYQSDVDTFAVELKRDGKRVEAALDTKGAIHKLGMGHVEQSLDYPKDSYTAPASDPMPFGQLHLVSQSELLYALKGQSAASKPAAPGKPAAASPSTGKYPFVEQAKTGRSSCVVCAAKIAQGTLRVGVERLIDTGSFTRMGAVFVHATAACMEACPELKGLTDLDTRLTQSAPDLWPPRS